MLSITIPEWLMFVFEGKNIIKIAVAVPLPPIFIALVLYHFIFVRPLLFTLTNIWINSSTVVAIGYWLGIATAKLVLMWLVITGGFLIFSFIYKRQIQRYMKVRDREIGIKQI